ncbi:hypothetical protein [Thioclava atlantica]|uniref:Uncharacterized protein n=1 Tax=Thioclava atlantica TaxID=1317124 RepID=A0A085U060_9RHOB|nr:hypothetical protein [Thioclava atlantica]KFE36357.1 hypothetical protein DW2_03574 [Thioclava atlantica]
MQLLSILRNTLAMTGLVTSGLLYLHDPEAWRARFALTRDVVTQVVLAQVQGQGVGVDVAAEAAPEAPAPRPIPRDFAIAPATSPRAPAAPLIVDGRPVASARFLKVTP